MLEPGGTHVCVGVDIVGISRIVRLVTDNPDILDRLFTAREIAYCQTKRRCHEHMAARFAAKEAVLKAFGTGLGPQMLWTDVEVVNEVNGRPRILLHGAVAERAQERKLLDIDISLSHTADMAIACAIVVWEKPSKGGPDAFSPD